MTLFRQILLLIIVCFSVNLVGVLWLEFNSTRSYLANQLESDLNNTSTSLSMALTPHLQDNDKVLQESTINAYFDGGFYELIQLKNLASDEMIVRQVPIAIKGVPDWFVNLDLIKVPTIETTITDGWLQAGELTIKGHPGFAYKQLWDAFVAMSAWILSLSAIVIGVAGIGISHLLKPLSLIQRKAQQIQERNFGSPLELPRTKELRLVTDAINRMTEKLREQFEEEARLHDKLKQQAFQDATTGLGNRAFFNRQLRAWLEEEADGAVVFLEINGLDDINKKDGFNQRDAVIKSASQFLLKSFNPDNGHVVCRLSAHEFSIIAHAVDEVTLENRLDELNQALQNPHFKSQFYTDRVSNIGAVMINQQVDAGQVLSASDTALSQARKEVSGVFIDKRHNVADTIVKTDLKQKITTAIEQASLGFARQPVFNYQTAQHPVHMEVYAQLKLETTKSINAASFISVLDEFELGHSFDKKVIQLVLQHIKANFDNVYAVNLTASALKDHGFIAWLIDELSNSPAALPYICFEFSEESAIYNREKIEFLCTELRRIGVQYGVDRVGRNFSSLSYLQSIHPNYVKIDHAYTQMAIGNKNDAYFVGSLCTTIHNLDVTVIATRVENTEQLEVLKEYHFDAYQGFIYKPEPFNISK